jgi:RNA polymerase sigma factor (sigma-70 family)
MTITLYSTELVRDQAMDDRELLAECRRGRDEDAFAQLVERYSRLVYSICLRTLNDREAAEDASQAVFLVFSKRSAELKPDTVLATWFFVTARNCARELRRTAFRRSKHEQAAAAATMTTTKHAGDSELWAQVRPNLDAALESLPAPQREAIVLRYLSGLSESDAARVAACPEKTLRTRLNRGLERLRERLCGRDARVSALVLSGLLLNRAGEQVPAHVAASITAVYAGKAALPAKAAAAAQSALKGSIALGKIALAASVLVVAAATVATQITPRAPAGPSAPQSAPAPAAAEAWTRVGPFSGESYPLTLCIVPKTDTAPQAFYAGCRPTGVFKSTDGGKNWTACAKIPCSFDIGPNAGSLRSNPIDPESLYLGVESNGVFKSTDGGKSWTQSVAGLDGFAKNGICFAFNPTAKEVLYLGTDDGIYRSPDAGATWERERDGLPSKKASTFAALVGDPNDGDTVYGACMVSSPEEPSGVYKRSGATWSAVNSGLPDGTANFGQQKRAGFALAMDPKDSTILYLSTASGGLYKTENAGGKWSALKTNIQSHGSVKALFIDPQKSACIIAGLTDGAIFRSDDGGATWTDFGKGLEIGKKGKKETIQFQGKPVEAEHEAGSSAVKEFAFDAATRTLYVARCDGLYSLALKP